MVNQFNANNAGKKYKILIDLDGVLNEYGKEKFDESYIPPIKENSEGFLKELYKIVDLYLFTTRNQMLAVKWLIKNNIDMYFTDVTNIKIPSYLYVDDRCVCYKGDYKQTLAEIKNFKAYWK